MHEPVCTHTYGPSISTSLDVEWKHPTSLIPTQHHRVPSSFLPSVWVALFSYMDKAGSHGP